MNRGNNGWLWYVDNSLLVIFSGNGVVVTCFSIWLHLVCLVLWWHTRAPNSHKLKLNILAVYASLVLLTITNYYHCQCGKTYFTFSCNIGNCLLKLLFVMHSNFPICFSLYFSLSLVLSRSFQKRFDMCFCIKTNTSVIYVLYYHYARAIRVQ